jgi:hypothetical protein
VPHLIEARLLDQGAALPVKMALDLQYGRGHKQLLYQKSRKVSILLTQWEM